MKKDLNIENIISILEKENYKYHNLQFPYGMVSSIYDKIIKELLDTFFNYEVCGLEIYDNIRQPPISSKIYLKEKGNLVENGYKLEFNLLYPFIIIKLWENSDINFNINEFGVLYSFLVNNYKNVKKLNISKDIIILWKTLINYTFSILINPVSQFIRCDYISFVTSYMNNFYDDLIKRYNGIILCVDTDTIYLDFMTKEFIEDIKKIDIPFDISNLDFFLMDKKKIIEFNNGNIKSIGLKKYKSNYQLEKDRIKKLKKIKSI
ncbi:MAG: hypothetical protein ACOCVF_04320 [bacterium]